jgi:hypothetical protein
MATVTLYPLSGDNIILTDIDVDITFNDLYLLVKRKLNQYNIIISFYENVIPIPFDRHLNYYPVDNLSFTVLIKLYPIYIGIRICIYGSHLKNINIINFSENISRTIATNVHMNPDISHNLCFAVTREYDLIGINIATDIIEFQLSVRSMIQGQPGLVTIKSTLEYVYFAISYTGLFKYNKSTKETVLIFHETEKSLAILYACEEFLIIEKERSTFKYCIAEDIMIFISSFSRFDYKCVSIDKKIIVYYLDKCLLFYDLEKIKVVKVKKFNYIFDGCIYVNVVWLPNNYILVKVNYTLVILNSNYDYIDSIKKINNTRLTSYSNMIFRENYLIIQCQNNIYVVDIIDYLNQNRSSKLNIIYTYEVEDIESFNRLL